MPACLLLLTCRPAASPSRYFSSDEQSEYISMAGKHDFGAMHFGMLLGVLGDRLHSLTISRWAGAAGWLAGWA